MSDDATRERRADAQRNIVAILDAALDRLVRDPNASMQDIARAAGVGRVTLYGHFGSRAELLDAVFARTLADADRTLQAVDLAGDQRDALARLIASSWHIVDQCRLLLHAAQLELPAERIRQHHQQPLRRVEALIRRGRRDRVFRTDLPVSWMVAVFHNVLHSAADEIGAGRLAVKQAPKVITATLLAAYSPAAARSPSGGSRRDGDDPT